VETATRAAPR